MKQTGSWLAAAALAVCAALPGQAAAAYPEKPIRLVVPFSPGGSTDTLGRLLADALPPILGQPVIVENKPGAGGNIGGDLVARADPDGYTLLLAAAGPTRSEEHTSELQSLMRNSYAVFCLQKKKYIYK